MADSADYYTYRLTNIPTSFHQNDIRLLFTAEDEKHVTAISIGPCPHQPAVFNVASVTFDQKPSFGEGLVNGETRLQSRMPDFESIRVDDTFYGLTPLNTVTRNARADLIAITGLAGRAFGSWQNENGTMWLRDFLPSELSDTRIFIYGYPSKLYKSQSRASIQDYSEAFTKAILSLRSKPEEVQRPLILIGHSLGCIIIKQALVESISFATPIPDLYRSVCGIVFFAAPHRGLNNPELENILLGKPPEDLVRDLRPDSSLLISLNQRFPYVCKDIRVISCYEMYATKSPQLKNPNDPESEWEREGPPKFVVHKTSACLDWPKESEIRIPVHADHSKIAKLTNSPGSEYHRIMNEIKSLVDRAPDVMKRRQENDLAKQDILNLFFMLQYEYFWFRAWETYRTGSTLPRESFTGAFKAGRYPESPSNIPYIPYGHPAYTVVTEIHILLDMISVLLAKHGTISNAEVPRASDESTSASGYSSLSIIPKIIPHGLELYSGKQDNQYAYDVDSWSSSDRNQFGDLMRRLRKANDRLLQLGPHAASLDLIASSKVLSKFSRNSANLERMENVSKIDQLYSSLSKRAALRRQYRDVELSKENAKLLVPISWIKVKDGTGSSNYRFITPLRDRSTPAQTDIEGSRNQKWVLVEWRSYKMANDLETQRRAKAQAFQLARDLNISNKPPLLKTLHCVGFIQDSEQRRFGFLFELPPEVDIVTEPLTLHSYLQGTMINGKSIPLPTLSERVKLAQSLAFSVIELHGASILHKSLHSANILFFPTRFTKAISIDMPFIGGFEFSRPDQDGQLSIDAQSGSFDIYKHPELRDTSNEVQGRPDFERRHDVYSLGLILLEIGIWQPLRTVYREEITPIETTKRLISIARRNLPHQMGSKYCEAVLECLDHQKLGLSNVYTKRSSADKKVDDIDDDERGGVSLELFIEKVIQKLEACHCRE